MSNDVTIRISRSSGILGSLDTALLSLDSLYHKIGQPVMVQYYNESSEISSIIAIGTGDGLGRENYSILTSNAGVHVINSVRDSVGDVTDLGNCEVFVAKYNGAWSLFKKENGEGIIRKLESPEVFYEAASGYRWFFANGVLKCEKDFVTKEENDRILDKNLNAIKIPELIVTFDNETCVEKGKELINPMFSVHVTDYSGKDISRDVKVLVSTSMNDSTSYYGIVDDTVTVWETLRESCNIHFTALYEKDDFSISSNSVDIPFYFVNPIYYTKSSDGSLGAISKENSVLWNGLGKLDLPEMTLRNEYLGILVPPEITVSSIYDSFGTNYFQDFEIGEKEVDGINYVSYIEKESTYKRNLVTTLVSNQSSLDLISSTDKDSVIKEIRTTVKSEIKSEVLSTVRETLVEQMENEVKSTLRPVIEADLKRDLIPEIEAIVVEDITPELKEEIQSWKPEIKAEIKEEITDAVKDGVKSAVVEEITPVLKESITESLKPEVISEVMSLMAPIMITKEAYAELVANDEVLMDRTYYIYNPEEDKD